jgi:hypothetical protein
MLLWLLLHTLGPLYCCSLAEEADGKRSLAGVRPTGDPALNKVSRELKAEISAMQLAVEQEVEFIAKMEVKQVGD